MGMMKLLLENGDGDTVLLSENLSYIRGVLRWLVSRGAPDLAALCGPLADECRREEAGIRKAGTLASAREGERQWGEPVIILEPGKLQRQLRPGDEISLNSLDELGEFKYAAAQMALQRARKDGTFVGILFKGLRVRVLGSEDEFVPHEVRFCRVSDMVRVFDLYPEACAAWKKNQEDEGRAV